MATAPTERPPPPKKWVYRGVRLQTMSGPTRFSRAEIKRAVEAAIVKNADALGRGGL